MTVDDRGEMDRETHRYFPLVEDTYRPDGWGHPADDYPHTVEGLAALIDGYR